MKQVDYEKLPLNYLMCDGFAEGSCPFSQPEILKICLSIGQFEKAKSVER